VTHFGLACKQCGAFNKAPDEVGAPPRGLSLTMQHAQRRVVGQSSWQQISRLEAHQHRQLSDTNAKTEATLLRRDGSAGESAKARRSQQ